jgi:hypothetical protein
MRRLISNRKLLINPSNGVLLTNPLACGFVEFVIEKSVVHMSWRGLPPFLGPWTSAAAKVLVGRPCIRSLRCAALLNVGGSRSWSPYTRHPTGAGSTSGWRPDAYARPRRGRAPRSFSPEGFPYSGEPVGLDAPPHPSAPFLPDEQPGFGQHFGVIGDGGLALARRSF